jgi:CDP-diglyceride synthetase
MSISPQLVDYGGMALALIVPAYIVLRFPRWQVTVLLGTIAFWLITVEQGYLLAMLDPSRDAAMVDSIWLFIGWIPGLAYSWLLYGVRLCSLRAVRFRHPLTNTK